MKKRLISLLFLLFLLTSLLTGCGKSGSTLPPLGALAALPETRLGDTLQGYKRDDLLLNWGEPERTMQGNLGDVWQLDENREVTILYDEYGKVFVVTVKKQ